MHGAIHHIDLTVSDLPRAIAFYDAILGRIGYRRSAAYDGGVPCWELAGAPAACSIGLHLARRDVEHDRYAAGLHHLAFHAASRAEVGAFHRFLVDGGYVVLDAPAEYDYSPGYYAVFFADPDGMKLELVREGP